MMKSFQQVHSFLRQWGLIPALSSTIDDSTPILLSQLLSGIGETYTWILVLPWEDLLTKTALLDSKRSEIYSARSLPSLPVTTPSTSCSSLSTQKEDFFYDQEEENYRLDSTPASITDGSLPLEAFLKDYQSHEKLAVDLTPRSFFAWAGDATRAASSEVQGVRHADSCNNKERRENSDGGDET